MTKPLSLLRSILLATSLCLPASLVAADRSNILWVSSEDNGPELGCYGDDYAVTPNIDKLSEGAMRYLHCSSNAPVCAPARTTIIGGLYPPSTGGEHMCSETILPEAFKMFSAYLREAGYYTSNRSKTDYNYGMAGDPWVENGGKAHWRNRKEGQPFFCVFNCTISHESKIRNDIDERDKIHDPAKARIPAYHPDTPESRKDWAQYYDRLTMMDHEVGDVLDQLEADGLVDDTIVLYWGDHGSGMPRHKRWPYNSGLQVPLIVRVPAKWQHLAPEEYLPGGTSDRMVGFIDFAPSMLSIAGIEPKPWMQGSSFLGQHQQPARAYNFGFRGRMDERVDCVRAVADQRYHYVRHFMPHRPCGQYVGYMFVTPTTAKWKHLFDEGKLNEAQSAFWKPKPSEELFDLDADPDEVNNLADDPAHAEVLARFRKAQADWAKEIIDVGMLPEHEIHARAAGAAPYDMARTDKYDFHAVYAAALGATSTADGEQPDWALLRTQLCNPDAAVRYWGATGHLVHGGRTGSIGKNSLAILRTTAAGDPNPAVRAVAAEALGRYGNADDLKLALDTIVATADPAQTSAYASLLAVTAFDELDEKARPIAAEVAAIPKRSKHPKSLRRLQRPRHGKGPLRSRHRASEGRKAKKVKKPKSAKK